VNSGFTQSRAIDSLQNLVLKGADDSVKVNQLGLLTTEYFNIGNYDSVLTASTQALNLSKKIGYTKGEA
jgi:hypothetical protein